MNIRTLRAVASDLGVCIQRIPMAGTQAVYPFRYTRNPFHNTSGGCSKIVETSRILGLTHQPHEGGGCAIICAKMRFRAVNPVSEGSPMRIRRPSGHDVAAGPSWGQR